MNTARHIDLMSHCRNHSTCAIHLKFSSITTRNNRKTGVNVADFVNKFYTLRAKCWTTNFCTYACKGPAIITSQLKSIYNTSNSTLP